MTIVRSAIETWTGGLQTQDWHIGHDQNESMWHVRSFQITSTGINGVIHKYYIVP